MFFKVLAAMVTADAFDRHMRDQQYRARAVAEEQRAAAALGRTGRQLAPPAAARQPDLRFPERRV
jgi:hypothetical protein